jgi:hypothetical protein
MQAAYRVLKSLEYKCSKPYCFRDYPPLVVDEKSQDLFHNKEHDPCCGEDMFSPVGYP